MDNCRHWFCGLAPHTEMERLQAQVEAMYERDDQCLKQQRFIESPNPTPTGDDSGCRSDEQGSVDRIVP